jgi:hypothetical protein
VLQIYTLFVYVKLQENTRFRENAQRYQYVSDVYWSTKNGTLIITQSQPNYWITLWLEVPSIQPEPNHSYANFPHAEVNRIWLAVSKSQEVYQPTALTKMSLLWVNMAKKWNCQ